MKSRVFRITVSLLLSVTILCFSFSIYAVDGTYPPQSDNPLLANDQTAAYLVWELLKSWGIDIQYQDISNYTNEVQNWILNEIYEFLGDQPSVETVGAWIADWVFGTDFWGNLVVNDTLLDDVNEFADWLVDKFGWVNNSTDIIGGTQTVSGVSYYDTNTWYETQYGNGSPAQNYYAIQVEDYVGQIGGYAVAHVTDQSIWYLILLSSMNPSQYRYYLKYMKPNGDIESSTASPLLYSFHQSSQGWWYQYVASPYRYDYNVSPNQVVIPDGVYFEGNSTEFNDWIANLKVVSEGDLKYVISVINLPDTDPNYTPGDSMTIIDGEPDYSVIDWDGSVNVSNLPSIISTGVLENPEIDQIYTNIPPLVEEATDSMEIMRQIIFRMPDEVLIALYALLAVGVIFGFLRIMREH